MTTLTGYPQRVPKQRWTPPSEEVARLLTDIAEAYQKVHEYDAEFRRLLAEAAEEHDVPVARLADILINPSTGKPVERKTVYRYLGRSMT